VILWCMVIDKSINRVNLVLDNKYKNI
jgi:hypothetical protein